MANKTRLNRLSDQALSVLQELMNNDDTPARERLGAATVIARLYHDVKKQERFAVSDDDKVVIEVVNYASNPSPEARTDVQAEGGTYVPTDTCTTA